MKNSTNEYLCRKITYSRKYQKKDTKIYRILTKGDEVNQIVVSTGTLLNNKYKTSRHKEK